MELGGDNNDNLISAASNSNENLEERMMMARFRAMFENKVREFNEVCWDLCIDKAGAKLDQKTEMCLSNCVDRFVDTSKFIGQRFLQTLHNNNGQI